MNIAVFDLETNGLQGSSVLSASSLVFDPEGRVLDVFNRFYMPRERPDPYAARIHGLTPRRILALRGDKNADAIYFLEDWPSLLEFWQERDVEGIVVHNLPFDTSFLPDLAQISFRWWCSMRGMAEYCLIPKRPGNVGREGGAYKWPRLSELADCVCNSPAALAPSMETKRLEGVMGEVQKHVSLSDCFELYRVVSRVARHRPDLMPFLPCLTPFRPPRKTVEKINAVPQCDPVVARIADYEKKLRAAIACRESASAGLVGI